MTFNFYYIAGISRVDTLRFESAEDMDTFMSSALVTSISLDAYYPPFYRNFIKLPIEADNKFALNFESEVNYLSFEYGGRTYYYFIDSVEYISESVFGINITMDTLMSYYFDYEINYSIVERQMIERWNNTLINRDYIRENFSKADKEQIYYKRYVRNTDWYSLAQIEDEHINDCKGYYAVVNAHREGSDDFVPSTYALDNEYIRCEGFTKLAPVASIEGEVVAYFKNGATTTDKAMFPMMYSRLKALPDNYAMYFLPFAFLDYVTCTKLAHVVIEEQTYIGLATYYDDTKLTVESYGLSGSLYVSQDDEKPFPIRKIYDGKTLDFVNSATLPSVADLTKIPYSSSYIPCLMDSNYYDVHFGEGDTYSEVDLYLCLDTTLILYYFPDISTGSRIYQIDCEYSKGTSSSYENLVPDKLGTIVACSNPISISLYNDPWFSWAAQNKLSGPIAASIDGLKAFMGMLAGGVAANQASRAASLQYASINPTGGVPNASQRYKIRKTSQRLMDAEEDAALKSIRTPSNTLDYLITAGNKMLAPRTFKSLGNLSLDLLSKSCYPSLRIYRVQDYEAVARAYNMYGNRVDRLITSLSASSFINSSTYFNRYYFNFIKLRDADITIPCLVGEEVVADLTSRFTEGIRFWNTAYPIGTYQYDNIEVKYL